MSLTSISVIMTVFVLNLHHRGPNKQEVPNWIRKVFLGRLTTFLCVGNDDRYTSVSTNEDSDFLRTMSLRMTLDNIAQELQSDVQIENGGMADTVVTESQGTTLHDVKRDVKFPKRDSLHQGRRPTSRVPSRSRSNEDIMNSLRRILYKHDKEDRNYEIIQEWRRVAQVVDRILFFVFLLGTFFSTIAILVIAPSVKWPKCKHMLISLCIHVNKISLSILFREVCFERTLFDF